MFMSNQAPDTRTKHKNANNKHDSLYVLYVRPQTKVFVHFILSCQANETTLLTSEATVQIHWLKMLPINCLNWETFFFSNN